MENCKFCLSEKLIKDGYIRGLQRYQCKECDREQVEGDRRVKYDNFLKKCAVILYLEGNGLRSIARALSDMYDVKLYFQTVAKWLKHAGHIVEQEVDAMQRSNKKIEIVEMDELYTYIKKKRIRSASGLLLIGMSAVYLNLKSVTPINRLG